jgi:hypothetical protein
VLDVYPQVSRSRPRFVAATLLRVRNISIACPQMPLVLDALVFDTHADPFAKW